MRRRRPFNEDDYYKRENPYVGLLITGVIISLLCGAVYGVIKIVQWLTDL